MKNILKTRWEVTEPFTKPQSIKRASLEMFLLQKPSRNMSQKCSRKLVKNKTNKTHTQADRQTDRQTSTHYCRTPHLKSDGISTAYLLNVSG
jgi:hypothetical protein